MINLFFCQCSQQKVAIADANYVNSFYIKDYSDIGELLNMEFASDTELISCAQEGKIIHYRLAANSKFFKPMFSYNIPKSEQMGAIASFAKLNDDNYIIGDYNYNWFLTDGKNKTVHLFNDKQMDRYALSILKYTPLIITQDSSLIFHSYYKRVEDYMDYFSQGVFNKYKIVGDSLKYISSYINKPKKLANFRMPFARYTYNYSNKNAYIIYPPYDTIYQYSIEKGSIAKYHINNAYYSLPTKYNLDSAFSENSMQYDYNYQSNNFEYLSINYNPHSKHFILFFSAPQLKKIDKNQNYAGIILDSNLKTIKYIDFSKYTFFVPECFIQFPSGKLGMPIYDNNKSIKREHFKVMVFDY